MTALAGLHSSGLRSAADSLSGWTDPVNFIHTPSEFEVSDWDPVVTVGFPFGPQTTSLGTENAATWAGLARESLRVADYEEIPRALALRVLR